MGSGAEILALSLDRPVHFISFAWLDGNGLASHATYNCASNQILWPFNGVLKCNFCSRAVGIMCMAVITNSTSCHRYISHKMSQILLQLLFCLFLH